MLNRHGLIAGATGTGKTKTLQLMAGQLSKAGVPVFVADIKGDLTGLAAPGDATNPKLIERVDVARLDLRAVGPPGRVPVAVGRARRPGPGDRPLVRAAAAGQGPRPQRDPDLDPGARLQVLRRQRPAAARPQGPRDDAQVPLVRRGQADPRAEYGGMSSASVGVLLRSIVVLEQEGADVFFGEPEFDVEDLLRTTPDGEGVISILELSDVMDKPRLFSHVHALDARPAVRDACPRPATCRSPSCASSSTRRTCSSTTRPRR